MPRPSSMMAYRYSQLEDAVAGLDRTGVPLVGYDGAGLTPAGFSDDAGLYYVVPGVARAFGLTLDQAIDLVLVGGVLAAFAVGAAGTLAIARAAPVRAVCLVALALLARSVLFTRDVYAVAPALAVAVIPWALYFLRRRRFDVAWLAFGLLAGAAIGIAQWLRSHGGTAVAVFLGVLFLADPTVPRRLRAAFAVTLLLGVTVALGHFASVVRTRDTYLAANVSGYQAPGARHPFWHSVYIGLGYLDNGYGIRYRDEVAAARVAERAPQAVYLSPEYEAVLRDEVRRIGRGDPDFLVETVAAKAGVVLWYFFKYANLGVLAALAFRKPWRTEAAFRAALVVAALPGLLVRPLPEYLLGFIAIAALYGLVSLDEAAAHLPTARVPWRTGFWPAPARRQAAAAPSGPSGR